MKSLKESILGGVSDITKEVDGSLPELMVRWLKKQPGQGMDKYEYEKIIEYKPFFHSVYDPDPDNPNNITISGSDDKISCGVIILDNLEDHKIPSWIKFEKINLLNVAGFSGKHIVNRLTDIDKVDVLKISSKQLDDLKTINSKIKNIKVVDIINWPHNETPLKFPNTYIDSTIEFSDYKRDQQTHKLNDIVGLNANKLLFCIDQFNTMGLSYPKRSNAKMSILNEELFYSIIDKFFESNNVKHLALTARELGYMNSNKPWNQWCYVIYKSSSSKKNPHGYSIFSGSVNYVYDMR